MVGNWNRAGNWERELPHISITDLLVSYLVYIKRLFNVVTLQNVFDLRLEIFKSRLETFKCMDSWIFVSALSADVNLLRCKHKLLADDAFVKHGAE